MIRDAKPTAPITGSQGAAEGQKCTSHEVKWAWVPHLLGGSVPQSLLDSLCSWGTKMNLATVTTIVADHSSCWCGDPAAALHQRMTSGKVILFVAKFAHLCAVSNILPGAEMGWLQSTDERNGLRAVLSKPQPESSLGTTCCSRAHQQYPGMTFISSNV